MKLAAFYDAIAPFLEGRATLEQATRGLPGVDAPRLAIYGRFCRVHRFTAVDKVFAWTRAALGDDWERIVDGYFLAHPMHHPEINENGADLPAWLDGRVAPWIAELADFEWWEWRTRSALDDPADTDEGPPRLASTVELRPYHHDLVAWIDGERAGAPGRRETIVLFWRDRDLDARRENATPHELRVLKSIVDGAPLRDETFADLREAGIVVGA